MNQGSTDNGGVSRLQNQRSVQAFFALFRGRSPLLPLPYSPKSKTSTEAGSSLAIAVALPVFPCIVPIALISSLKHSTQMLLCRQQRKPKSAGLNFSLNRAIGKSCS